MRWRKLKQFHHVGLCALLLVCTLVQFVNRYIPPSSLECLAQGISLFAFRNVLRSASPKYLLMSGNWQEVPHAAWSRSAIMYNADACVRGRQKSRHSGLCKGDFHPNSWSGGLIGRRSSAFLPPLFLPHFQMRLGRFKETWYLVAKVTKERS